jgi:hypothetical protein
MKISAAGNVMVKLIGNLMPFQQTEIKKIIFKLNFGSLRI